MQLPWLENPHEMFHNAGILTEFTWPFPITSSFYLVLPALPEGLFKLLEIGITRRS
jgi:hypothetical protein